MVPRSAALCADRYQFTMMAAYAQAGLAGRRAVFELFARRLPPSRRYMVACGIGRAAAMLQALCFSGDELSWFERDPLLGPALRNPGVRALFESFRFRGRVLAVPEGRICFPGEPLVRVEGTLAEAQLVETLLLSILNHDTRIASKCARITRAARGRACIEFGSRRTHEAAAVDVARAAYVGGFAGTSNEQAARAYGIPPVGTMAHAYVLAHAADDGERGESAAFQSFARSFDQGTTCLVDTFDVMRGVDRAIESVGAMLSAIRIDSGDLGELARQARQRLDAAGSRARIVLSDDLDEYRIDALVRSGVPVDVFGVGTSLVSTPDHPSLGAVYKLVALEDRSGRMVAVQKRAPAKGSGAAPKQVYRPKGTLEDTVVLDGETGTGDPLLAPVLDHGEIRMDLSAEAARLRYKRDAEIASDALRSLELRGEGEGFPLQKSAALNDLQRRVDEMGLVRL